MDLLSKKCHACEGNEKSMIPEEAQKYMAEVMGWELIEGRKIQKEFKFKDFKEAIAFVNEVAEIAEEEGHHPDIYIHGWNNVRFELSTHAIHGLSENDFIMAAKIDHLKTF